jgi:hypothetical protein
MFGENACLEDLKKADLFRLDCFLVGTVDFGKYLKLPIEC